MVQAVPDRAPSGMTVNCTWSRAIRAGDEDGSRAIAAGCETREISTDRRRRDGAGSLLSGSTETVHAADGADGWENMGASLTQTATLRTPFCGGGAPTRAQAEHRMCSVYPPTQVRDFHAQLLMCVDLMLCSPRELHDQTSLHLWLLTHQLHKVRVGFHQRRKTLAGRRPRTCTHVNRRASVERARM